MEEELKKLIKEAVREVMNEFESKQPDEVLSVKQLCGWLGVSPAWVSENKDKLNIPYFKMGGDKFYRKDIENWIEENKAKKDITIIRANIRGAKNKLRIS
jgi:predicted DNA-binding transcriptional regulator AlpA